MRARLALLLLGLMFSGPGCVVISVAVQNPIPGMNTIAVTPFVNLTQEPPEVVDGRRFALAYFAELQKTKGFQVIPVGVVEVAIVKNRLNMTKKEDVLALARILKADAVVVGAITDYTPYYPQRIGMQVDWYSPDEWPVDIKPGLEEEGVLGLGWGVGAGRGRGRGRRPPANCDPPARKSDTDCKPETDCKPPASPPATDCQPIVRGQSHSFPLYQQAGLPLHEQPAGTETPLLSPGPNLEPTLNPESSVPAQPDAAVARPEPAPPEIVEFDPRKPVMSYTRMFDGAEADVVNGLRDYLEMRGDLRSGGWEGHLHRSEDFIRFTAHLMIVEMLSLHGGVAQSQIVLKWRKYQY